MGAVDFSQMPFDGLIEREWLIANQLGGYASSTLPGLNTRKYHGLLVAAMTPFVRQMVILSRVEETVICDGKTHPLACSEYPGIIFPQGHQALRAFSHDPFPRWGYQGDGWTIEKQVQLVRGQNTVCLSYTLLGGHRSVDLEVRPLLALRGIHELSYQWNGRLLAENQGGFIGGGSLHHVPATSRTPECFFAHDGRFGSQPLWYLATIYRREQERGYAGLEDLWTPGVVRWTLEPGQTVHFVCATDPIDLKRVISQCGLQETPLAIREALPTVAELLPNPVIESLVRAADQFVLCDRDNTTCIMSGYPWVAPVGRDCMIALPGLLLVTGRLAEAQSLLRLFAGLLKDGLMPSELPVDGSAPRYQSADASLWFVNAVWQYLRYGGDAEFVEQTLLPVIDSILRHYRGGASLGISVTSDGLLRAHQPGTASSWMNAGTVDGPVTPRYGQPVELNALWYNAQRIAAELHQRAGATNRALELTGAADRTRLAFNEKFWNPQAGCCFDVLTEAGRDASIRPNQLLAISLPFAVLDLNRHAAVLDQATSLLLTPLGVRTLAPFEPGYKAMYAGNAITRDCAYHQGSAFPWLLGPYITAMLRVRGRSKPVRDEVGQLLHECLNYLTNCGLGQVCELFDGNPPHHAGGLPASARSIAELLRCYIEDVLDILPAKHIGAQPPDPRTIQPSGVPNPT